MYTKIIFYFYPYYFFIEKCYVKKNYKFAATHVVQIFAQVPSLFACAQINS